jgi:hypothetical protein
MVGTWPAAMLIAAPVMKEVMSTLVGRVISQVREEHPEFAPEQVARGLALISGAFLSVLVNPTKGVSAHTPIVMSLEVANIQ